MRHIFIAALPLVLGTAAASGAATAISTYGAQLDAPTSGRVGQSVTAVGTGVKPGHDYRLTFDLVAADKGSPYVCSRSLGTTYRVTGTAQRLTFKGHIPATLSCSRGPDHPHRYVPVRPGTYRWVLADKLGKATYDRTGSIVVKRIAVR